MSLDPVLARHRHYVNVPKSKPIPTTPNRSQTSLPHSYSRSDLLALSLSSSPSCAPLSADQLHHPPIPTSASPMPATASRIGSVNRILRKDSGEFIDGLIRQGRLPEPEAKAMEAELKVERERERSRTMPIPPPIHEQGDKTYTSFLPQPHTAHIENQHHIFEGFSPMRPSTTNSNDDPTESKEKAEVESEEVLDFEINSTLSPISIELMSAHRSSFIPSNPIPLPSSASSKYLPSPGSASASAIFNRSLGSTTPYSPCAPSPLAKSHEILRTRLTPLQKPPTPASKNPDQVKGSPIARSPSTAISNVTIVSSPIEDLPWRKSSLSLHNTPPKRPLTPRPKLTESVGGGLNAFAAPFPLPKTTPPSKVLPLADHTVKPEPAKAESLTLPLPPSLPAKPTSILPPVFVKRESAMLPQSMALPDVPPMGEGWHGDNSLSGNEKRRRASEMGLASRPGSSATMSRSGGSVGGSAPGSRRPENLVRLGQRLKENNNRPVL